MTFDAGSRAKYTGKTVKVKRNHENHELPKNFAYIKRAEPFTHDRFSFDVREVPDVIKALQAVYDDYLEMLEDAKPKPVDVLNGLGIGAVIRTLRGSYWVKTDKDSWSNGSGISTTANDVVLAYSETVSEGVHL